MIRSGTVYKSAEGWARFQARTQAGKRKRPAFQRSVRVKGGSRGK